MLTIQTALVISKQYLPETLIGLISLIAVYAFSYLKTRNTTRLKEIESASPADRIKAIEMNLNDLGVSFDTTNLTSNQKVILIKELIGAKNKKYGIAAIVIVVLSLMIGLFIILNKTDIPAKHEVDRKNEIHINGDKVGGDKVNGDKVNGDKNTNYNK